jgi:hypothetical protein
MTHSIRRQKISKLNPAQSAFAQLAGRAILRVSIEIDQDDGGLAQALFMNGAKGACHRVAPPRVPLLDGLNSRCHIGDTPFRKLTNL